MPEVNTGIEPGARPRGGPDWAAAAVLMALTAAGVARYVHLSAPPFEDAAMLMRYATHLAEGQGITWNVGAHPVDGATDFLFMVLLGGVNRAGLSIEHAVRAVDLAAHAVTVLGVYAFIRWYWRASWVVAGAAAAFVALGPALHYTEAAFGTPWFGLTAAAAWATALYVRRQPDSWRRGALFGVAALVMGMTRPEGALLALLMMAGILTATGWKQSRAALAGFVAVFGLLGIAYFAWRWQYFGYPLPNPYYKKGGSQLHFDGLSSSIRAVARMTLPWSLLYVAALRSRPGRREALVSALPILGFTALWTLLSSETNFDGRFQYAVVPIVVLSAPALVRIVLAEGAPLSPRVRSVLVATAVVVTLALPIEHLARTVHHPADGNVTIGQLLAPYASRGYTLASTEAGVLPLYSGWRAIDAWGLNDAFIAHHGTVTDAYLDQFRPEVILVHGSFSPADPTPAGSPLGPAWDLMTVRLRAYAEARGYRLAASYGTNHDTFNYYVKPGFPDSSTIASRLAALRVLGGRPVVNLAPRQPTG